MLPLRSREPAIPFHRPSSAAPDELWTTSGRPARSLPPSQIDTPGRGC